MSAVVRLLFFLLFIQDTLMPDTILLLRFALLLTATLANCGTAGAQDAAPGDGQALNQILLAISNPSPEAGRIAEEVWKIHGGPTADVLTQYAMALAFVRNNRHQQAFDLVEGIPPVVRKAGPLRRLRVWLLIRMRKDELAQPEVQSMLDELQTKAKSAPAAGDVEDMQFLAKVVTYFEQIGNRPEHVTPAQAAAWRKQIEGFPAAWQTDVPVGREAILTEHAERTAQSQAAYKVWRVNTDQELTNVQGKVAELQQQATGITDRLTTDRRVRATGYAGRARRAPRAARSER